MAEAEEALQKLQRLLPQLQAAMGQQGASWQGPQLFQAHAALLWAVTCMERCTRADPSGQGLLLAPAMAALPQVRPCNNLAICNCSCSYICLLCRI